MRDSSAIEIEHDKHIHLIGADNGCCRIPYLHYAFRFQLAGGFRRIMQRYALSRGYLSCLPGPVTRPGYCFVKILYINWRIF